MKIQTKGQVTISVIIAVVIVATIVSYFVLRDRVSIKNELSPDAEGVQTFIQECLDSSAREVVYYVGQRGGYFALPEFETDSGITYYYKGEKNYMPTKKFIEDEIALFTAGETVLCIDEFKRFPSLTIKNREINFSSELKEDEVVIYLHYPVRITKGESTTEIEDFETKVSVRLGAMYDSAYKLFGETPDYEAICLSCIVNEGKKNNLEVQIIDENKTTKIFIFSDNSSKIENKTFEFIFANEYKLTEDNF